VGLESESQKAARKLDENDHLFEALKSEEFLRVRSADVALNPKQRIPFTLVEHFVLSPDRFFQFPNFCSCVLIATSFVVFVFDLVSSILIRYFVVSLLQFSIQIIFTSLHSDSDFL